jgi:hypothetical protein
MEFEDALRYISSEEWVSGSAKDERLRKSVLKTLLPASRTAEGRATIGASPHAVEGISSFLREPTLCLQPVGTLSIRLLRNLCARSPPNQHRAAAASVHDIVLDSIQPHVAAASAVPGDDKDCKPSGGDGSRTAVDDERSKSSEPKMHPFVATAVEFLCNFATGNAENADLIWKRAFPETMFLILECSDPAVVSAGTALLHNCIAATPQRASDLVCVWNEVDGKGRSFAELLISRLHAESGASDLEEHETFSWSFMVIRRLVAVGLLREVFNAVGPPLEMIRSQSGVSVSPYQTTLLCVLDAAISKYAENEGRADAAFEIPDSSMPFFTQLIVVSWAIRDGTSLRLSFSIAGSVMLLMPGFAFLRDFKLQCTTVAVNVLKDMHEQAHGVPATDGDEWNSFAGLRGTAVRLIALSCDRDEEMQDLVRTSDGLVAVLSALSYEKDTSINPFLREWAVMAVRNLCLGNAKNAEVINMLELVDVQTNQAVLERAGLEAFMDSSSGRPRLRVRPHVG